MDQQKRMLIAIGLSFALTLAFSQFVWKPKAEADAARLAALDAGTAEVALALDGGAAGAAPVLAAAGGDGDGGAAVAVAPPAVPVQPEAPLRSIDVTRDSMKLEFTSEGASLTDAVLTGTREREQQRLTIPEGYKKLFGGKFPPPPQMDLAQPPPTGPGQLAISIAGATPLDARLRYQVTEEKPGRIVFQGLQGPWQVTKTFSWEPKGYELAMDVEVKNVGTQPAGGELAVHAVRGIDPAHEDAPSMFGGIGNQATVVCRHEDKLQRKAPKDEEPKEEHAGAIHFVGIDQQYFLTALWAGDGPVTGRCVNYASTTERRAELFMPLTVQPGQSFSKSIHVFMGPKAFDLLTQVGKEPGTSPTPNAPVLYSPELEKTVDFGWWAVICKALIVFLRFFHVLVGNWGVAIILLTVGVKIVLLPLTHRAMVSAEAMKKLQPKMEVIKKKYPDDRDRQNQEMMKLYQEAKVNPLGGCLPLLLQLPIWAALFTTLRTSYELYGEPFVGVWSDLTFKDPTYLLPLALGITMIITQRLQPQMMDKSQAMMMTWVMPIFFTAIMMNYPAGLALYIFTNNLLSILQQWLLRKYLARTGQAAPPKGKDDKKDDRDAKKVNAT